MIRWILTAIALLLLLRLVLRFVLGVFQGLATPPGGTASSRGSSGGPARIAGELVRDPVCSTYIPRESAITARVGGETRHYCSTACRDKDAGGTQRMGRAAHG